MVMTGGQYADNAAWQEVEPTGAGCRGPGAERLPRLTVVSAGYLDSMGGAC
jgi:hypothetical protein